MKNIQKREIVYVEDVIEDLVGARWNQGNVYRLQSCEAKWIGEKLKLLYKFEDDVQDWIG